MPTIKRGENAIIRRNLFAEDGTTPVLISSLNYLAAQVKQYGVVMATYSLIPTPNPVQTEIRQGLTTSQVEVEITKQLSDEFKDGSVTMKLIMKQDDAEFKTESELKDIDEFEIFVVEI